MIQVLTNHIGYNPESTKNAVFQSIETVKPVSFAVVNVKTGEPVYTGTPVEVGEVANWNTGYYYTLRFDEVTAPGKYYIRVETTDKEYCSFPFAIDDHLLELRTISNVTYYFKAQRPTGELEACERNLPFQGSEPCVFDMREGRQDVHGGWYDATGDYGVHLSHLSHTHYFNPQQAAFSAYVFFKVNDLLNESDYPYYTMVKRRILDEGMYGVDFLMRMRAPSGSFFRSKGRGECFGLPEASRCIDYEFLHPTARAGGGAFGDVADITDINYECSIRSGAGYAIAALAYASRVAFASDYSREEYLDAAVKAFEYMIRNNEAYASDGKWNLVDEYCILDAAVELYKTTHVYGYLMHARKFANAMAEKYVAIDDTMGYLSVDGTKRPFFHAADAGMPVVNLLNYCDIENDPEQKAKILDLAHKLMRHELAVTNEVANPFGYARQFVQRGNGEQRNQFFYPHDVETAPWWQGENARIASLATAARSMAQHTQDAEFAAALGKYADDQLNWVLGLNPYDSCMMEGSGRNTNAYFFETRKDFIHCPGGIVNGITGGLEDEDSIEFITEPTDQIKDNWRWAEQWIPHGSWFIYALAQKKQ